VPGAGSGTAISGNNTYNNPFKPPSVQPRLSIISTWPSRADSVFFHEHGPVHFLEDGSESSDDGFTYIEFYYEHQLLLEEGLNHSADGTGSITQYLVGTCDGMCKEGGDGGPYCVDALKKPCAIDRAGYDNLWVLKRASIGFGFVLEVPPSRK